MAIEGDIPLGTEKSRYLRQRPRRYYWQAEIKHGRGGRGGVVSGVQSHSLEGFSSVPQRISSKVLSQSLSWLSKVAKPVQIMLREIRYCIPYSHMTWCSHTAWFTYWQSVVDADSVQLLTELRGEGGKRREVAWGGHWSQKKDWIEHLCFWFEDIEVV